MIRIGAEYEGIIAIANKINELAQSYLDNIGSIYQQINELANYWEGIDNLAFKEAANSYKQNLTDLGKVINNYANFLIFSVNKIKENQNNIAEQAGRL